MEIPDTVREEVMQALDSSAAVEAARQYVSSYAAGFDAVTQGSEFDQAPTPENLVALADQVASMRAALENPSSPERPHVSKTGREYLRGAEDALRAAASPSSPQASSLNIMACLSKVKGAEASESSLSRSSGLRRRVIPILTMPEPKAPRFEATYT